MALDATARSATANRYSTVAEADAYHANHLYATVWTSAVLAQKEAALIWATRLLDEQVDWCGEKSTKDQALRWPRWYVADRDGYDVGMTVIPGWLKNATAEMARHLLAGDRTTERSIGLQSVTADTVEVVFDKHDVKPVLPPSVRSIVEPYGRVTGPGSGTAQLVRA